MDAVVLTEGCARLLAALWRASWQGALVMLAVWVLVRTFPKLPAWARAALWWLGCLRLLLGLLGLEPVALRVLPAEPSAPVVPAPAPAVSSVPARAAKPPTVAPRAEPAHVRAAAPRAEAPVVSSGPGWLGWGAAVAVLAWALVVAWQLRQLWTQARGVRALLERSEPVRDARVEALVTELCEELGLGQAPRLRQAEVPGPLATGLWRPVVVLPASHLRKLSPAELRMAIAHELAHLRRGDLWLIWVPALAQALFFFHPLARFAFREHALAREAACDALALEVTGAAPDLYGRLLLRFGVAPRAPHAAAAGGASTHFQSLKRRLVMLQEVSPQSRARFAGVVVMVAAVGAVGLVPWKVMARPATVTQVLAAAPTPAPDAQPTAKVAPAAKVAPVAPVAKVAPVSPVAKVAPVASPAPAPRAPPAPPSPVVAPAPPAPPAPPAAPHIARAHRDHDDDHDEDDDEGGDVDSYVLAGKDATITYGRLSIVEHTRDQFGNDFLWARIGGQQYVIKDKATLDQAWALMAPQRKVTGEMEALGRKMQEVGLKQAELGREQAKLGLQQADLGVEQARQALERRAGRDAQFEQKQKELEKQQRALEERQQVLEKEQDELEKQMDKLEDIPDRLERQTRAKLHQLVTGAVSRGTAEKIEPRR
ncbi:MAG TPA: M56 family metallopeptidase [Myxococcaceae bacterium]|nr:M56 family metallopeptidase [Myxococcaceae bacterium]